MRKRLGKMYKNRGEQCAECNLMKDTNKEGFCFDCWEEEQEKKRI